MVQRYSVNECASTGMDHNNEGDYVTFDDYDRAMCLAQDEYLELANMYHKLVMAIGELYREA